MTTASRSANFEVGDRVQLTDVKGRHHTIVLEAGREFHTNHGAIAHDDLIGKPEGSTVTSTVRMVYLALRPLIMDCVFRCHVGRQSSIPRTASGDCWFS